MQTQRKLNAQSVKQIMSGRTTIPADMVGSKVKLTLQGNGNVIDVTDANGEVVTSKLEGEEGTVLQKKIFNVRANSAIAMANPRNHQYLKDGLKAEKAGDADKAHDLFNKFLNAVQVSFGIIINSNPAVLKDLTNGTEIAAKVDLIETENGKLLTIDPKSISVVPAATLSATSFDLADFMEEEVDTRTPAQIKADEKKAAKLAGAKP